MYRLLAVVLLAAVALAADEKPVTKPNVTARGYYAQDPVPPVATQPIYYPVYPPPPGLEDRNVCDLDAGVLLVTDRRHRHHHGQYKAVRVRCSEIANYDEDSCNVCCQNAARRDRNLPNTAMFGFLALTDGGHKHQKDSKEDKSKHSNEPKSLEDDEDENTRKKRGADWSKEHEPEQTRVKQEDWIPDPQYKNLKCVCCAPKRPLPVYQFPVYQQPAYGQPQYPQQQPTYQQQQPVQNYQAPAQQPQQYVSPPASPPQQNYAAQAPAQAYQAPAQAPAQYQAPAQAPAQYQAQAPPAQTYQPPAQQPPQQSYQQPAQAPAAPPTNYQSQQQAPVSY